MSKNILSQEQIDAGLVEATAAVERGRKALAETRAARARIGITPEKVQRFVNTLAPADRAWINSMVASSLAKIESQPAAAKAPRKPRRMV